MKITKVQTPRWGLHELSKVDLSVRNRNLMEEALTTSGGSPPWRARKKVELEDLLRLSQIAPLGRLHVERVDLREHLRAVLFMRVPVPCRPDGNNQLTVADFVALGLTYPRDVLQKRLPGIVFMQILEPHGVWHANVGEIGQPLCLGAHLPVGVRVVELVLSAYGALSMQTVMINQWDPAGVVNRSAAQWWQQNIDKIPLSKTPFLVPDEAMAANA